MEFLIAIIGSFAGGMFMRWIANKYQERQRYPYEWTCPICKTFTASASQEDIINAVKIAHESEHKYRGTNDTTRL